MLRDRSFRIPWLALGAFLLAAIASNGHAQGQPGFEWPEKAKNLRVLPKKTSKEELRSTMVGFSRALGVRCAFCHVGEEGKPLSTFDFPSDKNPMKGVARGMVKMVTDVKSDLRKIRFQEPDRVPLGCVTCHHGHSRPMTLVDELRGVYETAGIDSTLSRYGSLRARFYGRAAYDFGEESLNDLAGALMDKGRFEDAILILKLNVEQYPASSRAYDSLAEAYLKAGQKEQAIQASRKALELDPKNRNAERRLKELGSEGK
jgi:tetratricopeptide (TPR) repeat protein